MSSDPKLLIKCATAGAGNYYYFIAATIKQKMACLMVESAEGVKTMVEARSFGFVYFRLCYSFEKISTEDS